MIHGSTAFNSSTKSVVSKFASLISSSPRLNSSTSFTMDIVAPRPTTPLRKRIKSELQSVDLQLYKGPPNFEVLGTKSGKNDGMFILVKGKAFTPLGPSTNTDLLKTQTLASSATSSVQRSITPGPNEARSTYHRGPNTTYQRSSHTPYPYDNTTMLSDQSRHHRPPTISRFLNAPSHLLRESVNQNRTAQILGSRSLHTSQSKPTQILFQSSHPTYSQPSQATMGTMTPTSQLASQFSTAVISRQNEWNQVESRDVARELPSSSDSNLADDARAMRARLRELRAWELTMYGRLIGTASEHTGGGTRFTILSYNILAQKHLINHAYLYRNCNPSCLEWPDRFQLLMKEINDFRPTIICLQEVEEDEFEESFTPALSRAGYRGAFKKRPGDKFDGCAIFWSGSMFSLVGKLGLDLRQNHVPILDRDHVALMLKLESKAGRTKQRLVVVNTHLLFNPKRMDVKLAQVQLLLAELDRFSFAGFGRHGESLYLPTLLCGDFNVEPHSNVATLITEGSLRYLDDDGYLPKSLRKKGVDKFIPVSFGISDQCQHYKVHLERVKQWLARTRGPAELDRKTQLALINVQSDSSDGPPNSATPAPSSMEQKVARPNTEGTLNTVNNLFDLEGHELLMNEIRKMGIPCSFGGGTLSHDLKLRNIYEHKLDHRNEKRENGATTKQGAWTCVDFIFQGMQWNFMEGRRVEGNLKLIKRLRLLTRDQCKEIGPIPNMASPSDHYPLLAEFLLK